MNRAVFVLPLLLLNACGPVVAGLVLAAEASKPPINKIIPTRGAIVGEKLEFLSIGKTTQKEVLLELGEPECYLESDNAFVYWWVDIAPSNMLHEDYLVIAFDDEDRIRKFKPIIVRTYQAFRDASARRKFNPEMLLEQLETSALPAPPRELVRSTPQARRGPPCHAAAIVAAPRSPGCGWVTTKAGTRSTSVCRRPFRSKASRNPPFWR